jgi:hypothetical protein
MYSLRRNVHLVLTGGLYSRCLHGAMRGHAGVVKSMTADLTDETNVAQGFSMLPMAWSVGFVIGFVFSFSPLLAHFPDSFSPLVGGILSRPQDRWPNIFSHPFWAEFPYFLPCLVAATSTCISFIIGVFYLEEVCCFLLFEESYLMVSSRR